MTFVPFLKPVCWVCFIVLNIGLGFAQPYAHFKPVDHLAANDLALALQDYKAILSLRNPAIAEDRFNVLASKIAFSKSQLAYAQEYEDLNAYLTQILALLVPSHAEQILKMKVKIVKDPGYNAFTFMDGSIYFNIGLLAEIENEAALAAVLGHEYSHYLFKDSEADILRTIESEKNEKKDRKNGHQNYFKKSLHNAHFNQSQEQRADSMGYNFSTKAGYDVKYEKSTLMLFFESEKEEEAKKNYANIQQVYTVFNQNNIACNKAMMDFLSSHPEAVDRIKHLELYLKNNKKSNLKDFILKDKSSFEVMQKKCKIETLRLLMQSNEYVDCIQKAFRFHLFDPQEPAFVYFILEAIRREVYLDPSFKQIGFLSESLGDYLSPKKGVTSNIALLLRDTTKLNDIKALDFKVSTQAVFNTYDEAFLYFYTKAAAFPLCEECNLSVALYNYPTLLKGYQVYLNRYLSAPDVQYKNFALAFKNNQLGNLFAKTYLYVDDILFYTEDKIKLENGNKITYYFPDFERAVQENNVQLNGFEQFFKVKPREAVFNVAKYKNQNFALIQSFENTLNTVCFIDETLKKQYTPENINLFVFAPEIWTFASTNDIKSIRYLKSSSNTTVPTQLKTDYYEVELGLPQIHVFGAEIIDYSSNLYKCLIDNVKMGEKLHLKNHLYNCLNVKN
ncbi:MAG: hypothetical protein RL060_704 [Bacteroidota bacterium]|jgi:Zn-dependent protease with chaperone function